MSMTAFKSELRSAVRDVRETSPTTVPALAAPKPPPAAAQKRTVVRLWLPLTPLWVLLAPFAILCSPFLAFAPQMRGANPLRVSLSIGAALFALSGTVVDVDTPDALVRIRIY